MTIASYNYCDMQYFFMPERSGRKTSVAFLLTQIGTRAAQDFGKALAPLGLTPPDAGILRLLGSSPGLSQQELARRLDMHASRLVAIIDALEQRGIVVRKPNAEDRRVYSLELTAAGRETLAAVGLTARAHDDAVCAGLTAAESEQLGALLEKLAASLGLMPGIHPGYRRMGAPDGEKGGQSSAQTERLPKNC